MTPRRKSELRKKYAQRRSLVKCDKCRHTARNHINLRRHSARYHPVNITQKQMVSIASIIGRHNDYTRNTKKRTQEGRKGDVPRGGGRAKSSLVRLERLVALRDDNLETPPTDTTKPAKTSSIAVRNDITGIEVSPNGRTRRMSRKTPKAAELPVTPPGTKLRSSRSSEDGSLPAKVKKTKPKTGSFKSKRADKKKIKRDNRGLIPLPCHLCEYVGRDSYNLRRHMQSRHEPKPPKVQKIYHCGECEYKNKHRFLVKRHSATHSRDGRRGGKYAGFSCDKCDYVSASACNLKRHQLCRHEKPKEAKLQCSLCDHREPDRPALFCHFREAHGVIIETERLEFNDYQSFMDFKNDTEKATFARFVRQQTRMGEKKHVIFKCHRDGIFKSKSRGERKRALKTTGSNKINSACPASMRMTTDPSGKVSVVFTKTHVGHSNEVCRLTLTKDEKILIAEMLESKRTFQDILCEIRNGMESERLERIHLLSRKDLQNIERWYKTRDVEDAPRISIDINIEDWVAKITPETSVVRLYKKPATILPKPFKCLEYDDFILVLANDLQLAMLRQFGDDCICIDNAYENSQVKLTTMMVLDDSRQGFPCAFMLSSKIDKIIMKVFLEVIKKESGCPMTPSILISDIPDYRRTEWGAVMDLPVFAEILYSPWSIEDDLQRNLLKIKNETEREEAYTAVKNLILEKSSSEVPRLLENTLKLLYGNPSTELFGKYFKSKFADTAPKWATGFRKRLPADSSDKLEGTHDLLKFVYSEGMKNQKLEDCICVLMTCGRDQLQDRVVLDDRAYPKVSEEYEQRSKKLLNSIAKRHEDAVSMKSRPVDSGVYEIMENNLRCRCGLRCFKCDICIHSYRCTCSDSILGWTICRHTHFCVMSNPVEHETSEQEASEMEASDLAASHPFDPAEEKRKLLLEFENMCVDIAGNEDSIDETAVAAVSVLELPREDYQLEQDLTHHKQEHPEQLHPPSPAKHQQQQVSSFDPPQVQEDVKSQLQWRFKSICQQMSSDKDVTLIEQALASIENAIIASKQNSIQE